MNKNQNDDKRNQGNTGSGSTDKTNQNSDKEKTNPNNPVADTDKKNGTQNTDEKQNDAKDKLKNIPDAKTNNSITKGTDDETVGDQTDSTDRNQTGNKTTAKNADGKNTVDK
jgi:hypothetical protein